MSRQVIDDYRTLGQEEYGWSLEDLELVESILGQMGFSSHRLRLSSYSNRELGSVLVALEEDVELFLSENESKDNDLIARRIELCDIAEFGIKSPAVYPAYCKEKFGSGSLSQQSCDPF